MPPDAKLPDRVIADFRAWVEMGAPLPEVTGAGASRSRSSIDLVEGRKFWSFLPASERALPAASDSGWPRNRTPIMSAAELSVDTTKNNEQSLGLRPAEPHQVTARPDLHMPVVGQGRDVHLDARLLVGEEVRDRHARCTIADRCRPQHTSHR